MKNDPVPRDDTFGIRRYAVQRTKLRREAVTVTTPWGAVKGKRGWRKAARTRSRRSMRIFARVAREQGLARRTVYEAVRRAFEKLTP